MLKHIITFLKFFMPILGKAVARSAADELTKYAGAKGPRFMSETEKKEASRVARNARTLDDEMADAVRQERVTGIDRYGRSYHDVIMVAFDISGVSPQMAQQWLIEQLPNTTDPYEEGTYLDAWWIANDERFDGSDCDSAVFVRKGYQEAARAVLREHGLVD